MTPQEYTEQMHGEVPQGGLSGTARVPLLMGHQNQPLGLSMGGARVGYLVVALAAIGAQMLWLNRNASQAEPIVKFGLPACFAAAGYYMAKL